MKHDPIAQRIWVKYMTLEYSWEPIQVGAHCHIDRGIVEIPEPVNRLLEPTREEVRFEQYKQILP